MKKFLPFLMIVSVMSLVLAGCGEKKEEGGGDTPAASTDAEKK